jgi:putative hydrolase of the HAD superfamily
MKDVVLFDLGNTLVRYFERHEFPRILEGALSGVQNYLRQEDLLHVPSEVVWQRVEEENHESRDHRVRPLEGRLARIFGLDEPKQPQEIVGEMCRQFMAPIFARGCLYDDTLPTLDALRTRDLKTAIISNTPWGSPADLWRKEMARLGLVGRVNAVVFCGDVGWRKPDRQIFEFILQKLRVQPDQCIFVGDDPRWDIVGPRAVGIEAILIDRRGAMRNAQKESIQDLSGLWDRLGLF